MKYFLTLALVYFTLFSMGQDAYYIEKDNQLHLTEAGASHFAALALDCVHKEYPNKLSQLLKDSTWLQSPKELHPAFYGCYDWHSSVHGHWMLVRLLKLFPDLPEKSEIKKKIGQNITKENIGIEVNYLVNESKSWERMYGWSWLMKLAEELHDWDDKEGQEWKENLQPLVDALIEKYMDFLPKQQYPVRTGVHPNTAFGMSFAYDYAKKTNHRELLVLLEERARFYYMDDTDCPAHYEPSGEDFLSGCLEEANLMQRVLSPEEFNTWFKKFLPKKRLQSLMNPADVSDRTDPKIVHLDGLNLSRAWCFYRISTSLKGKKKSQLKTAAKKHLEATIPNVATEHYVGSHWLASFAVYSLSLQ